MTAPAHPPKSLGGALLRRRRAFRSSTAHRRHISVPVTASGKQNRRQTAKQTHFSESVHKKELLFCEFVLSDSSLLLFIAYSSRNLPVLLFLLYNNSFRKSIVVMHKCFLAFLCTSNKTRSPTEITDPHRSPPTTTPAYTSASDGESQAQQPAPKRSYVPLRRRSLRFRQKNG